VRRWEAEAKKSIAEIQASKLPKEAKTRHAVEIMETFIKDRAEMELLSIRTDLAILKDPEAVKAEMDWAQIDMKSERVPPFLQELFRVHYFELSALTP